MKNILLYLSLIFLSFVLQAQDFDDLRKAIDSFEQRYQKDTSNNDRHITLLDMQAALFEGIGNKVGALSGALTEKGEKQRNAVAWLPYKGKSADELAKLPLKELQDLAVSLGVAVLTANGKNRTAVAIAKDVFDKLQKT